MFPLQKRTAIVPRMSRQGTRRETEKARRRGVTRTPKESRGETLTLTGRNGEATRIMSTERTFLKRQRSSRTVINLRYCEVEVHGGVLDDGEFRQGRRQRNAVDVDGNGGRSHGGIDIQINGGGGGGEREEDEDDYDGEEEEGEDGARCATNDVEKAICIAVTAGDQKSSILNHLRWMSGGGKSDAKVRFLKSWSLFPEYSPT